MDDKAFFHEKFDRTEPAVNSSDRSFCFAFAICFALLGISLLKHRHDAMMIPCFIVSSFFLLSAVFKPGRAAPLKHFWLKLGRLMARVTNPLFLGLVFYSTFVPIGLCLRAMNKDPLLLKRNNSASYWRARIPPGPAPETMKNQF